VYQQMRPARTNRNCKDDERDPWVLYAEIRVSCSSTLKSRRITMYRVEVHQACWPPYFSFDNEFIQILTFGIFKYLCLETLFLNSWDFLYLGGDQYNILHFHFLYIFFGIKLFAEWFIYRRKGGFVNQMFVTLCLHKTLFK